MDVAIRTILLDLKIVALIEPHGRLAIRQNQLTIDNTTFLQSLKRFVLGDSRVHVIQRIKQRVSELEYLLDNQLIKEKWLITELSNIIEHVQSGLANLRMTYISDSQTCVVIDLVSSQLTNINDRFFL